MLSALAFSLLYFLIENVSGSSSYLYSKLLLFSSSEAQSAHSLVFSYSGAENSLSPAILISSSGKLTTIYGSMYVSLPSWMTDFHVILS